MLRALKVRKGRIGKTLHYWGYAPRSTGTVLQVTEMVPEVKEGP
jgi:hypothetical protein